MLSNSKTKTANLLLKCRQTMFKVNPTEKGCEGVEREREREREGGGGGGGGGQRDEESERETPI